MKLSKIIAQGCLLGAVLSAPQLIWAQAANDDAGTELLKPFKAKLSESQKFNPTPIVPKLDNNDNRKLNYSVPSHLKEQKYPAPDFRPLAYSEKKNKNEEPYQPVYIKLGFGYPISPLAELSYHSKPSSQYRYGLDLRHHSGQGFYNNNQRFANTGAKTYLSYFTKNGLAADIKLGYQSNTVRFYGYGDSLDLVDSTAVAKDSVLQRFSDFNAQVGIFNGKSGKNNLNYKADLGFYRYSDRYQSAEISLSPRAQVEKFFGAKTKHSFAAELGLNYVSFSSADTAYDNQNRTLAYIRPNFNYNGGIFRAKVGADLGSSEGKFYALPDLNLSLLLLNGKITAYGGWKGEIKQNNFRSLSQYCPFVLSAFEMRHTNQQDFYAGLRGSVKMVNYDARIVYSNAKGLPIFTTDTLRDTRRFNVLYDTASIFALRVAADMQLGKNLRLAANAAYNAYSFRNLKAYHLPVLESNLSLAYQKDKLQLKAELYANAGVLYFDPVSRSNKSLNGLFDLNLYADYGFNKNVSAFVALNNVLNNKNQRWFRYPQIGFNAMAGVIAKF